MQIIFKFTIELIEVKTAYFYLTKSAPVLFSSHDISFVKTYVAIYNLFLTINFTYPEK